MGVITEMDPQNIKFTQRSIKETYTSYPLSIHEHVKGLSGSNPVYKITDFPPIRVAEVKGEYCSIDNRRLWVLKHFGIQRVKVEVICPPTEEFICKLNGRKGDGTTVEIKGETGSHLIQELLRLSECPNHCERGRIGWKICTLKKRCRKSHPGYKCTKANPCRRTHLISSCGCISIVGSGLPSTSKRHSILETLHTKGKSYVSF